jgi:hypothetical protein
MLRRSVAVVAKQGERTIVRDPRKSRLPAVSSQNHNLPQEVPTHQAPMSPLPPPPFAPSTHNQQSVGSSLASYALAGVGVTLGVVLVRVVLGF